MNVSSTASTTLRQLLIGASLVLFSFQASAMELVMIEQTICPFCKQFDDEVKYSESETAKALPLRRIKLSDPWPQDLANISHDKLTPTFILVDNGKELGRLRGYPGKEGFWALLEKLMDGKNIKTSH